MLYLLVNSRIPFAIKSGGHSFVPGASNANETGVTIDLSALSGIKLSEDNENVSIGVGARWFEVYKTLESESLTVPGARAGGVGVGGFLLGGGISWFSNQYGWACDSVEAFEVVLASGEIVEASKHSHTDLFWALKGGGSLLGIVTSVQMRTIKSTGTYGGLMSYDTHNRSTEVSLINALVQLNQAMDSRSTGSGFISFATSPAFGDATGAYIVDASGIEQSSILEPMKALPRIHDSLRQMNLSDTSIELGERGSPKLRQIKYTLTIRPSVTAMMQLRSFFLDYSRRLLYEENNGVAQDGQLMAMTYQPLSTSHLSHRDNVLGFAEDELPLILVSVEIRWNVKSQDEYYQGQARLLYSKMTDHAKELGLLHPFVYMNYAASFQRPLAGYGKESRRKFQYVQDKYDPQHIFAKLQQGVHLD